MSTVAVARTEALKLSPLERKELTWELLDSLPTDADPPLSVDPEFEKEILRQAKSIEDGTPQLIDGEEFLAELRMRGRGSNSP
jgi:Putative addiction module component